MKKAKGIITLQLQMDPEGYAKYDGGALRDSLATSSSRSADAEGNALAVNWYGLLLSCVLAVCIVHTSRVCSTYQPCV